MAAVCAPIIHFPPGFPCQIIWRIQANVNNHFYQCVEHVTLLGLSNVNCTQEQLIAETCFTV